MADDEGPCALRVDLVDEVLLGVEALLQGPVARSALPPPQAARLLDELQRELLRSLGAAGAAIRVSIPHRFSSGAWPWLPFCLGDN